MLIFINDSKIGYILFELINPSLYGIGIRKDSDSLYGDTMILI